MTVRRDALIGMLGRTNRITLTAVGFLLLWMLAACSGTTAAPSEGSASSTGGIGASTPAADGLGVYPPPSGPVGTPDSKAVLHAAGTNSVYLPAIINQKTIHYPFELQQTGVLAVQGFFGCEWTAVAGQVFDMTEAPIQNLILHLEGIWDGSVVSQDALTGSAEHYGPAGYEFVLGTQPLDSIHALWIQMLDADHKEISPRVYFDTYNDCARNLILINFVQVR